MTARETADWVAEPSGPWADWISVPSIFGTDVRVRAIANASPSGSSEASRGRLKRAAEFAAGRRCASQALRDAGSTFADVGVGAMREPLWPPGFVGSISHSTLRALAAVSPERALRSIGVDVEAIFDDGSMREAAPLAMSQRERDLPTPLTAEEHATAIFSFKESLYKCLYPLTRTFFDFGGAEVEALTGAGAIRVRLLRDLAGAFARGAVFDGRYALSAGHVYTALELRR